MRASGAYIWIIKSIKSNGRWGRRLDVGFSSFWSFKINYVVVAVVEACDVDKVKTQKAHWTRSLTHSSAFLNELPNSLIYFDSLFVNKLWIRVSSVRMIESLFLANRHHVSSTVDIASRNILRRQVFVFYSATEKFIKVIEMNCVIHATNYAGVGLKRKQLWQGATEAITMWKDLCSS